MKKRIKKGKIEYFVRWKYYNDTTWEPEENLQNVLQMIEEFEKKVNLRVIYREGFISFASANILLS